MIYALLSFAYAVVTPFEEVDCPIETDKARIFQSISTNQLGGYDSDLARYSKGEQFRNYAISTCFENYFSLYGKDFSIPINKKQKQEILEFLTSFRQQLMDPANPFVWERYEIAAHIYEILGYSPEFIGQLYLEASWTVRDTFVGYHQGLEGPEAVQSLLREGPKELLKNITPEQKKLLLFNLARVAHRGGYRAIRDDYLSRFALLDLSKEEQKSLSYVQEIAIPKEVYYQKKALEAFKKSLENPKLSKKTKIRSQYLYAELLRRLGAPKEARSYYDLVQRNSQDELLKKLSTFFLAE